MSTVSTGWPSAVRKSALTVPSRERASVSSVSVEYGTEAASSPRSAAGRFVISLVAGAAARSPLPHLGGAVGGLAAVGQRLLEEREVHGAHGSRPKG